LLAAAVAVAAVLAGHRIKVLLVGVAAVAVALDLIVALAAAAHSQVIQVTTLMAVPAIQEITKASLVELVVAEVNLAKPVFQLADITLGPAVLAVQLGSILLAVGMLHGC
jgi:hypothetical protein